MRNFFASLFGALIGIFLAFFLVVIIIIGMVTNAVNSIKQDKVVSVNPSSVLEIRLNHVIRERTLAKPFHFRLAGEDEKVFTETVGLNDILADIDHASDRCRFAIVEGFDLNQLVGMFLDQIRELQ